MQRVIIAIAVIIAMGVGACQLLLPERFAVNAPIGQMLWGRGAEAPERATIQERMRAPEGFSIGIFADGLPGVRFMRFTPAGDLLVSLPRSGQVLLLERDENGDGRADGRSVLQDELNRPHGMDLRGPWLYVAETDAVARIRFDAEARSVSGAVERVVTGIPSGGNHWTRTLRFGPDGWMYVGVGSSCNVCQEEDPRRAAILRYRPDGSQEEIYATGLRNTVGFDWQPATGVLYGTDNGRDLLGDGFPPCELNAIQEGGFYGWPLANGDRVPDRDFGAGREREIAQSIPPVHAFRAHNAPLGITFVRGAAAPDAYRGAALVALHGSWNRTEKDGYKVVSLHWSAAGEIEERDFLVGFERGGDVIGRPVDVAEGPDGAFYVSDDYSGAIWRIAAGETPGASAVALPVAPAREHDAAADGSASAERGRALYTQHACASCHEAERAASGVVVKPLEGLADRYGAGPLGDLLATPPPPMPVFPLDETARADLAAYLLARFD